MDFEKLETITQGNLPIMNPISEMNLIRAGKFANFSEGKRVLDLGCGNGTALFAWQRVFKISGDGIELSESSGKAAKKLLGKTSIQVIIGDVREFSYDIYDAVSLMGTSFIYGGVEEALRYVAGLGSEYVLIGDRFWSGKNVPPEFAREWVEVPTAFEVVETARELGFSLVGLITATREEWNNYESAIWQNCVSYIASGEPGAEEVAEYLEKIQDEYLCFGREYMEWGMFVFRKV